MFRGFAVLKLTCMDVIPTRRHIKNWMWLLVLA